jgi:hypothetical protein
MEYSLGSLGPGHRDVSFSGGANFSIGNLLHTSAAPCWCDQPSPAMVWRKDAVESGEIYPRLR